MTLCIRCHRQNLKAKKATGFKSHDVHGVYPKQLGRPGISVLPFHQPVRLLSDDLHARLAGSGLEPSFDFTLEKLSYEPLRIFQRSKGQNHSHRRTQLLKPNNHSRSRFAQEVLRRWLFRP